jgi:predicted alpha/beta hydrolase family esterase
MYATHAQEPTIWLYAKNDSYFGPKFAEDLAQTWSSAGGSVEEHILQPYGSDGHSIADDRQGWDIWGPSLDSFLQRVRDAAPKSVEMADDHGSRSPVMIETSTITPRAK